MTTDTSVNFQLTLWTETKIVLCLVFPLVQNAHSRLGALLSFQI